MRMNDRKSMFFLFGVKGGLLFLITKKEKSPLKNSLFHLVFTDVNTSFHLMFSNRKHFIRSTNSSLFVHAVNSPLFSEQQKRFNAGYAGKKSLEPAKIYIKKGAAKTLKFTAAFFVFISPIFTGKRTSNCTV